MDALSKGYQSNSLLLVTVTCILLLLISSYTHKHAHIIVSRVIQYVIKNWYTYCTTRVRRMLLEQKLHTMSDFLISLQLPKCINIMEHENSPLKLRIYSQCVLYPNSPFYSNQTRLRCWHSPCYNTICKHNTVDDRLILCIIQDQYKLTKPVSVEQCDYWLRNIWQGIKELKTVLKIVNKAYEQRRLTVILIM